MQSSDTSKDNFIADLRVLHFLFIDFYHSSSEMFGDAIILSQMLGSATVISQKFPGAIISSLMLGLPFLLYGCLR